jgi:hypothetical protein
MFKLDYDLSYSLNAAVDGCAHLFEPWKVVAKTHESNIAVGTLSFSTIDQTILEKFTCSNWSNRLQDCYLNSV